MRKIFAFILCIMLALCFCACEQTIENSSEMTSSSLTTSVGNNSRNSVNNYASHNGVTPSNNASAFQSNNQAVIPSGYKLYDNGFVSFVIPNDWNYSSFEGVICGSNSEDYITVSKFLLASNVDLTYVENYLDLMVSAYEDLGYTLVYKNSGMRYNSTTEIIYAECSVSKMGATSTEVLFFLENDYSINIHSSNGVAFTENLFNSIRIIGSDSSSSNTSGQNSVNNSTTFPNISVAPSSSSGIGFNSVDIPSGYSLMTTGELAVAYPSGWTYSSSVNMAMAVSTQGDNIIVTSNESTQPISDYEILQITQEVNQQYISQGFTVLSQSTTNKNNGYVDITEVNCTLSMYGVNIYQIIYFVDSPNYNNAVILTLVNNSSSLINNVFYSIRTA